MDQGKIGNFIAELRKQKKMTQAELGDIVGVTGKAVSRWERGLNLPDRAIMNKVSEVLGVSATELLNGEKLEDLSKDNLDEITKNSVEYYKKKLIAKFKKIAIIFASGVVLLLLVLFMVFYFNNVGSCNVYSIGSESAELDAKGLITQTNDKTTIVISHFRYLGTNIKDVYSIDYDLVLNGKIIASGGYNLDDINYNKENLDIKKFFNIITIYLEKANNYNFTKVDDFYIHFRYVDSFNESFVYKLPLRIEKKFSNNKFVYFK